MASSWEYQATVVRVIDGDTVCLRLFKTFTQEVDFGFFVKDTMSLTKTAEVTFRLANINTPELHGSDKVATKRAKEAKAEVERLCALGMLRVLSYKPDKYGRWLADVFVTPANGKEIHINQALVEKGLALPWDGKGEKPV